jgi:sugar/nucleoside kinase (ribokinase family)
MDAAIFGNIVADVIGVPVDLRAPPRAGGLKLIDSITLTTGGNVCNVGMAMSRLGMGVAATGLIGNDILGRALVQRLKEAELDVSGIFESDRAPTSATLVAVDPGGERTFFHAPGTTPLLDADAFRRCFPIFRLCAWVQIGYFGLLPGLTDELPKLLVEMKQTAPGAKIALDTVDPPDDWKRLKPILPHLDLLAPSRPEAAQLTGENEPRKMVKFFRRHMPEGLIGIKLDSEGCRLDADGKSVHVPAYQVKVKDTTGAGDCWFAGLLTGLRKEMPLEQCARLANRVAADCCEEVGASAGVKGFKETMARL